MATAGPKTRGEQTFEQYLQSIGRTFAYEPPIGTRHPDYLVPSPVGDVLCEIKDLEQNEEDRAEIEAVIAGRSSGFKSGPIPFNRIQNRIRAASSQLREFKGKYPCLVVLFDSGGAVHLVDFIVLGAMYGETKISVPIPREGDGRDLPASIVFDRESRYLTPASNTTVSAVAILQYVSPNEWRLKEALAQQDFGKDRAGLTKTLEFVYDFGGKHPEVFERVPRLHVFRNIFAAVPWPEATFNGPHDLLWPIVPDAPVAK